MDIYFILFLISLGFNFILFLFLIFRKPPSNLKFEDCLYILETVISNEREALNRGLTILRKKYTVLGVNGKMSPPNNSIKEYREKKKELKEKITKRVIRQLSKNLINKLLQYYSDHGLAAYIISELDKDGAPIVINEPPR